MPTKKKPDGPAVDWYLISVNRLKQIGLVLLLVVLGLAGWWYFSNQKRNPRSSAGAAIAEARQALNTLAASKDFPTHRGDFDRAQHKLDEAGTLLGAGKYNEAEGAAVESQTFSRAALTGKAGVENDAQFLTVEGDVQYQKSPANDWNPAETRTPLFNGDWVKTGSGASAELIFSNGSLYTVGPNALLEVYSQFNPSTSRKNNSVQMQIGTVEVATTDDVSSVRTPGIQVTIDSESTTHVGVDALKSTDVGADGDPGPFSAFRRFRVSGGAHDAGTSGQEAPAPVLRLKRPYPIGGPFYMIEGKTDPGATVLINDEEADVEADGHFKKLVSFNKVGSNAVVVKAINASGKQTIQSATVLVEE